MKDISEPQNWEVWMLAAGLKNTHEGATALHKIRKRDGSGQSQSVYYVYLQTHTHTHARARRHARTHTHAHTGALTLLYMNTHLLCTKD